jgi:hypothetical protein
MNCGFGIGDNVLCTDSGIEGIVVEFYIHALREELAKILTCDGRRYHAPTMCLVRYTHA